MKEGLGCMHIIDRLCRREGRERKFYSMCEGRVVIQGREKRIVVAAQRERSAYPVM
jgi:hypothetical protein